MSFSGLPLHPALLRAVEQLGFTRPTPIQSDAIPPALEGKDVLACAQTGSGKTAAFLLPIIHRLTGKPRGTIRALVLVPTRELAVQVHEELRSLAAGSRVSGAPVFGGVSYGPQEQAFRNGVDVMIATPGRLLEHLRESYAKLDQLECLVLDEADRMLDMGFLPDVRKILRFLPAGRQTLCFSATMPPEIRALTQEMMKSPVQIQRERISAPPSAIAQSVYPVAQDLKTRLLVALLERGALPQALVFTRTKHRANRLADFLSRHGFETDRIHGNRSQGQRQAALQQFKSGRLPVLVATDIVARGIDIEDLSHVVNFDVPVVAEDYVHRIGRTGRAQASGEALTFMAPEERQALAAIERAVGKPLPRVTLQDFDYHARPDAQLEIPIQQRIAEIRKRKAEERARGAARKAAERKPVPAQRQPSREDGAHRREGQRPRNESFHGAPPRGEGQGGQRNQANSRPGSRPPGGFRRRGRGPRPVVAN